MVGEIGWTSADRAAFAVVNSATLTGFQTSIGPADFLWIGQTAGLAADAGLQMVALPLLGGMGCFQCGCCG